MESIYLGDVFTDASLRKQPRSAVRRTGKCIRGKNGSVLVVFKDGEERVVIGRWLRKASP